MVAHCARRARRGDRWTRTVSGRAVPRGRPAFGDDLIHGCRREPDPSASPSLAGIPLHPERVAIPGGAPALKTVLGRVCARRCALAPSHNVNETWRLLGERSSKAAECSQLGHAAHDESRALQSAWSVAGAATLRPDEESREECSAAPRKLAVPTTMAPASAMIADISLNATSAGEHFTS